MTLIVTFPVFPSFALLTPGWPPSFGLPSHQGTFISYVLVFIFLLPEMAYQFR